MASGTTGFTAENERADEPTINPTSAPNAAARRPPANATSARDGSRKPRRARTAHTRMAKHSEPAMSRVFDTWDSATAAPTPACPTKGTTSSPASTSSSPKWNATSMRFFEKREAIAHTSTAAKSAA